MKVDACRNKGIDIRFVDQIIPACRRRGYRACRDVGRGNVGRGSPKSGDIQGGDSGTSNVQKYRTLSGVSDKHILGSSWKINLRASIARLKHGVAGQCKRASCVGYRTNTDFKLSSRSTGLHCDGVVGLAAVANHRKRLKACGCRAKRKGARACGCGGNFNAVF